MASAQALLVPAAVAAGWVGQACFFTRFFLQWLASERARAPVVPRAFWWLSVAGSLLVGGYALQRGELVLLPGFVVGGTIAARNLWLEHRRGARRLDPRWLAALALGFLAVLLAAELARGAPSRGGLAWSLVAVAGQVLFVARFPVQWWCSERAGKSHFPPAFWWLSLAGNALLLAYAVHLGDALFVLGYVPGPLLQARNLALGRRRAAAA